MALACTRIDAEADLPRLIADKLHTLTQALGVSFATYDTQTGTLTVQHVSVSGQIFSTLNKLLGRNIIGLPQPVSSEIRQRMLTEMVYVSSDLTETTFGAIPRPIAAAVQKAFSIGNFTGLAFTYKNELWGTAVIVTRTNQPLLEQEVALTLSHVIAITMHRQAAEKALRHAEEKYRSIVENAMEGIFQSTPAGHFLSVNPAMARMYGYASPQEMMQSITDISQQIYANSNERTNVQHRLETEGFVQDLETLDHRKDGTVFWTSMNVHTVHDEQGQILYYEGTIEDITERKQAEAEREKLISELEAKNTELERFTYTVSHDLKAPLITIGGFLSFLEKDILAGNLERVKADVVRIGEATIKMQRLLNELLELSRIGRMMNPPQAVPFDTIAREAVEVVRGRIEERSVQVEIAPNLPVVYGDRARLVEVVQNLVDNACKFMGDQPQPHIDIGIIREAEGQPVFFVQDNGLGIDPPYHERIFGLFDKLDPKTAGTGIGLALVRRIIEVHGGRIWVESQGNGNGATFYFTLSAGAALLATGGA
ncbi:ATP-binding protein [Chloroflexota bacterium]